MKSNHSRELEDVYKKKVLGVLDAVVIKTALSIDRDLVLQTPVGNPSLWKNPDSAPAGYVGGRARSNWLASINVPRTDESDNTTRSDGDSVKAKLSSYQLGDTIYMTNNLPYIRRLNEGHSTQAPSGYIDSIVVKNVNKAKSVAKQIARGVTNA